MKRTLLGMTAILGVRQIPYVPCYDSTGRGPCYGGELTER
jgi:hypothetical protein